MRQWQLKVDVLTKFKGILFIFIAATGFLAWRLLAPVEIIDVHRLDTRDSFDIIVKNFPLTDKGKIEWWEKNKDVLKVKYNVPVGQDDYGIGFWVGEYKEEPDTGQGSDLLCFEDMRSTKNCIKKGNQPLQIWYRKKQRETIFLFDNWQRTWVIKDSIN